MSLNILSPEECNNEYKKLMEQWNENLEVFMFQRDVGTIAMTITKLDERSDAIKKDIQDKIQMASFAFCTDRDTPDGKKWYQLIVQPRDTNTLMEVGLCPLSTNLLNVNSAGFVYNFETRLGRDGWWCRINNLCYVCKANPPTKRIMPHTMMGACCQYCYNNRDTIRPVQSQINYSPELVKKMETDAEYLTKVERDIREVEQEVMKMQKDQAEQIANEWSERLLKDAEPIKVQVKKPKNPPKDGAKKNVPAKPPAFIRSPAGCQISNHLAVKKWMDKYGNK